MSYTQSIYHVVFRTKYREKTITYEYEKELYSFIWGVTKMRNSALYRIGGIEDHLHLLLSLSPSISLANMVRDIKACSSSWIKKNPHFPRFIGWGQGYAAFTCSYQDRIRLIQYIKNQRRHHQSIDANEELRTLLLENGCEYDENFFPDMD